jgi:hypothetical protein
MVDEFRLAPPTASDARDLPRIGSCPIGEAPAQVARCAAANYRVSANAVLRANAYL